MELVKLEWCYQSFFLLVLVGFGLWDSGHDFMLLRRQRQWWSWCDPLYNEFDSPYGDVKNVASNRAGHGHVPKSLPGHHDVGDQVRDWSPSGQDSQTYDLFTNANCLSNLKAMTGANRGMFEVTNHEDHQHFNAAPFNEFLLCAVLGVEIITMNKPQSLTERFIFEWYSDPRDQECSHKD